MVQGGRLDCLAHSLGLAVESVFPRDQQGGSGSGMQVKAQCLVLQLMAIGALRLRLAVAGQRTPRWARKIWAALPSEVQHRLQYEFEGWWQDQVRQVLAPDEGAAVYALASHTGVYFGKANVRRTGPICSGLAARALEHVRSLLFSSLSGWFAEPVRAPQEEHRVPFLPHDMCASGPRDRSYSDQGS